MISNIYLIVVVGEAVVPYPHGEVRGQQAVPQGQITAEVLGSQTETDFIRSFLSTSFSPQDANVLQTGVSRVRNAPVDVVVLMEVQQTRGDLKSHPLESQKVPRWQVRGHPVALPLGSQVALQVALHGKSNISSLFGAQTLLGVQTLLICTLH